ncbi:MAG: diaminopimelate epimerase [Bacteroidales bacterium]|nr:diaminopimelate epimerase [Bacteroidales bacterium]
MAKIEFAVMDGLGNTYIYVDADRFTISDPSAFSVKWSPVYKTDGLILISRSKVADFKMRIFNNDGSEAMMCGNGSRCVGKYVFDNGLTDKTEITLETLAGIKIIKLIVEDGVATGATVDMGEPLLSNKEQVATEDGSLKGQVLKAWSNEYEATYVCMGNPHCVIFVDDINKIDLEKVGPFLEHSNFFPQRANIEFVQKLPDGKLRMRVWERGSGITMACGTGACATAVAASIAGLAGREAVVSMDGGDLHIRWDEKDGHVYMTGPAETSFMCELESAYMLATD